MQKREKMVVRRSWVVMAPVMVPRWWMASLRSWAIRSVGRSAAYGSVGRSVAYGSVGREVAYGSVGSSVAWGAVDVAGEVEEAGFSEDWWAAPEVWREGRMRRRGARAARRAA